MGADVKGDIYESLLEKNAEDTKSNAVQYFTPPFSYSLIGHHLAQRSILADLDNLPDPNILAEEIAENLERALESFQTVTARLKNKQSYL